MSIFRAYLVNALTGDEMKSHPLNGKTWVATSGNYHDGRDFVRGTADAVTVADHADLQSIRGKVEITASLFDHPVVVKVWHGKDRDGVTRYDWRYLIDQGQPLTDIDLRRAKRCEERSNT
jgi:hypothetical protein